MSNTSTGHWLKISFITVIIVVFLSDWIQKADILHFPDGFRHLAIAFVFLLNWVVYGKRLTLSNTYRNAIFFLSFYLIVTYSVSTAPFLNYFLGICFTFLFLGIFVLSSNTDSSINDILGIFDAILWLFLLMSLGPIFQAISESTSLRFLPGYFRELGAFGSAMNIGCIIGISLYIITEKKRYLYIAMYCSFVLMMTILKKSVISNIIVWSAFLILYANHKEKLQIAILLIITSFIVYNFLEIEIIENYHQNLTYFERVGPEGHVRLGMYVAGFQIATDFFPFGSGMGSFGSLASISNGYYSHLYFDYGIADIGSNSAYRVFIGLHTLLDTWWPHILGELGFIGTAIFLYLWFYPLQRTIPMMRRHSEPLIKGLSFFVTMIIIVMSWEGFSLYTPETPAFIILHSGISGLCYYHIRKIGMLSDTSSVI